MKRCLSATGLAVFLGCSSSSGPVVPPGGGGNLGQSGGTGGTLIAPAANVLDLIVDSGPEGMTSPGATINVLYTTVTICQPGTSQCQTLDHVLLDTGSFGLRVLESLVTLELPDVVSGTGQTVAECAPFVDGVAWGPLKSADIVLGGETAAGLSIQLIGEGRFNLPADCTGVAYADLDTLGSKGILGVGILTQDCGPNCALSTRANPGYYYTCAGAAACSTAAVPVAQQVANPVAALPVDNNGVIIVLPNVAATGAPSVPGQWLLGIGTQENNGLGNATILELDSRGVVYTTFPAGSSARYASMMDSGSNGLFFLDAATTGLKMCTQAGLADWYCPTTTTSLHATLLAASGSEVPVDFAVGNLAKLKATAFAWGELAGPVPFYATTPSMPAFDWGLPFFFGRTVYTAIEGRATPAGTGPFLAF